MGFAQKAKEKATENENNRGSSSSGDYDGIDLTGDEKQVRIHPGTFVTGVLPEDEGNPLIKYRPYDDDAQEVNAGGNLGIVLDDPEVVVDEEEGTEGTIILESQDEDDSWDYRLYNPDRHGTNVEEGYGVEFDAGQGNRLYKGDLVDELEGERIILVVSGGGAVNVAKRLDVKGGASALFDYDDEYEGFSNGGLIEYPLYRDIDDDGQDERVDIDNNPVDFNYRYARRPELRPELYGQRIGVLMDWTSNMVDVNALDEDAAERFENRDGDSYYYSVFNIDAEEVIEETTEGEPEQSSYLEWRYDPDGRLPDDQYEFVEGYLESDEDTDEETIRENIEANAENFEDEPEADRIVEMIQDRA